jgi:hypothetical protein
MKQRMVVALLVLGLMTLGGGTAMAQDAQTAAPAPSYEPMPAADPVAAVNAWVDAFVAKQWSTLPALTCEQERDSIANSYDPAFQTFFSRDAVEALYDALTVELAERSAAVASSTEDTATVSLGGTLTYSLPDDALRTFVDALAAESSPAPTADEKEQYFQGLRDSLGRQVLVPEIEVVAEGGGWLVCGDIVTQAEEPSPSDGGEAGTDQGGGDISAG